MRSPPPEGSKNEVFIFRSVKSIVIHAANTGRASINRKAVISNAHVKRGVISNVIWGRRIFIMVVIMFMEATMDEIPAKCKDIIARSTEGSF